MTIREILLAGVWGLGASGCCAVYFNAEKKDIVFGAILGALGWMIYRVCQSSAVSEALGYFTGAFAVAACAELLAVILRQPATVFLVPGIIPLVPGGGIFLMMRAAVQGKFSAALSAGYSTLIAAGAIALGIAIASSVARIISLTYCHRRVQPENTGHIPDDLTI